MRSTELTKAVDRAVELLLLYAFLLRGHIFDLVDTMVGVAHAARHGAIQIHPATALLAITLNTGIRPT